EVPELAHEGLLYLLDAHAADHALDERPRGVEVRRGAEERLEVGELLEVRHQLLLAVTGEPADGLVELLLRPALALDLVDVVLVDARDAGLVDPLQLLLVGLHGWPSQLGMPRL